MTGIDGVTDAHRATWSRLTRLHLASAGLPMQTSLLDDADARSDDASAV